VEGAIDAAEILSPAVVAAEEAGATDFDPLGARMMVEGEQLGSFVAIPEGACLLALGRGGQSVRDVDLFVYDDAGNRLGADQSPNAGAATLVCPPHPDRVYVAARVVTGEGILAVGIMTVPTSRADDVARAVDVRGRPGTDTGQLASWPGLETRIRERRLRLGGRWEDLRRVAIPLHSRARSVVSFVVDARRCVDVLVFPADEVHGLEATIVDRAGRVLARGRPPGQERSFVVCSHTDQELTLTVRPRQSSGLAAVILSRSAEGAASAIASRLDVLGATPLEPLDRAKAGLAEDLEGLSLSNRRMVAEGQATVGIQQGLAITLPKGCVRIDVVGGAPLGRFTASLWSPQGRKIGEASGGARASLFACGQAGRGRIEVRADEREGPFAVSLARALKPTAALRDHPRAAGALLAWLDAAAGPVDFGAAEDAEVVSLPADQRVERVVEVPGEGCLDVVVAVSPPSAGLSYRALTGTKVIGAGRAERVLGDQLCDVGGPVTVELSLDTGGEALFLAKKR
jgi:hypothetical protein